MNNNFENYQEELLRHRQYFHMHPELGLEEKETAAYIRKRLEKLGFEIIPVAPTGMIAELPKLKKRKKTVVLRAEMDGLPIEEKTGLPYASVNPGCMHACGHDAILAVALTFCKILADEQETFPVNVRILFEPAEEIGEGARRMLDAGALGNPAADAFLMFHFAVDMPFGMAVHEGQASAMIAGIQIKIKGKASHWSEADKGIDSIYAGARAVQEIHDLNHSYKGDAPCLVGIGTAHGGEYANIIADSMVLTGNIRACREEDFYGLYHELQKRLKNTEKETGAQITLSFLKEPVLAFANDPEFTRLAEETGKAVFGDRFFLEGEDELFLAGDNAYRYFQKTRGIFLVFLAQKPGNPYPLHHPRMELDQRIFSHSLETVCRMIKRIGESVLQAD